MNVVAELAPSAKTGRPRAPLGDTIDAIDIVLKTGMPWRHLQDTRFGQLVHYTTIHKRFRQWVQLGVFRKVYRTLLRLDNSKRARGPRHYCIDSTLVKNQFGRDCLGRNPTDRGRRGTKLSALVDDRGMPVALAAFAANTSDFRTVEATFARADCPIRPRRVVYADKGYDSARIREFLRSRQLRPNVARRRTQTPRGDVSNRACVEQLFGWLDKSRRLLMRFETYVETYLEFTYLACSHLLARRVS